MNFAELFGLIALIAIPVCLFIVLRYVTGLHKQSIEALATAQQSHTTNLNNSVKDMQEQMNSMIERHESLIGHRFDAEKDLTDAQIDMLKREQEAALAEMGRQVDTDREQDLMDGRMGDLDIDQADIAIEDVWAALGEPPTGYNS